MIVRTIGDSGEAGELRVGNERNALRMRKLGDNVRRCFTNMTISSTNLTKHSAKWVLSGFWHLVTTVRPGMVHSSEVSNFLHS